MKRLKSQLGLTLTEVIVAAGLLGLVLSMAMTWLDFYARDIDRAATVLSRERLVQKLVQNIRSSVNSFQVDFNPLGSSVNVSATNKDFMKFAFGDRGVLMVSELDRNPGLAGIYPGRFGYEIRPQFGANGAPTGLYQIKLLVVDDVNFPERAWHHDLVVGGRW